MKPKWFVRGDLDGLFGLFVDNLLQLMLIMALCTTVCGFPADFVSSRILPGAAISILLGNLYYAYQARQLMMKTGRTDVTALPYGINTVSLFAYIFLVMAPVYASTKDHELAWKVGLVACLLSGVMETLGAFVADWLRKYTPRAALLSALAGIAITFISMGFIFQMFAMPLVAVLPMLVLLAAYAGKVRMPFGLPGGLVAVLAGTATAWISISWFNGTPFAKDTEFALALTLPQPVVGDLISFLFEEDGWKFLSIIFPMGLFNIIGSLQNLESAEAAGDRYETRPSLLANGAGTIAAAFLGSPFPTTIYIGHPGWKSMGARAGYSTVNGILITILCLVGGVMLVLQYIPLEAMLCILLWIGIIITAQAFQEVPKAHALAVAFGLIPSIAAWVLDVILKTTLIWSGKGFEAAAKELPVRGLYVDGICALGMGFLITAMIWSAVLAFIMDKKLFHAGCWLLAASALSFFGVIHAYELGFAGPEYKFGWNAAPDFALVYLIVGIMLLLFHNFKSAEADSLKEGEAGSGESESNHA